MNRREAVTALGALAVSACVNPVIPNSEPPLSKAYFSVYEFSGFASPRPEYGKVPGTQAPYEYPWEAMRTKDRVPLRGEYDESQKWVQEYRASLMESAGINCAVIQVEWRHAA